MDKELRTSRIALTVSAVLAWALLTGFFVMFHQFVRYDDEGYLMLTVKNFLEGGALFDEVYTQYGPAYYLFKWIVHTPFSLPVTHSVTRMTGLVIWVLVALASGAIVLRLTRSLPVSAFGACTVFLGISWITFEPGHPQDLCALLISLLILCSSSLRSGRPLTKPMVGVGVLLGALLLTKVSLGVFLGAALAVSFLWFGPRGRIKPVAILVTAMLALLLPCVIFYRYVDTGWIGFFVAVELALLASFAVNAAENNESFLRWRDYLIFSVSLITSILVLLGFALLTGSSSGEIVRGVLLQHLKFAELFYWPPPLHPLAPYWAIIGASAAVIFVLLRFRKRQVGHTLFIVLKLSFSICIFASAVLTFFAPNYGYLIVSFSLPFTWLVLVPEKSDGQRFIRMLIAISAILNALQVFPIAGTQMALAAQIPIICGAIVLNDGIRELNEHFHSRFNTAMTFVAAGFGCVLLLASVSAFNVYSSSPPSTLPGTAGLRLPEDHLRRLSALSTLARDNCTSLFSMPGMFSFNFWSGVDTPTRANATAWMLLLDDRQQQRILDALETSPRPCVIYDPYLTQSALRTRTLDSVPLGKFILENFQEHERVDNYIFLVRRAGR